jgi:beta-xylosidase
MTRKKHKTKTQRIREAWNAYGADSMRRHLRKHHFQNIPDSYWDGISNDELFAAFQAAQADQLEEMINAIDARGEQIVFRYGFMEDLDMPRIVRDASSRRGSSPG